MYRYIKTNIILKITAILLVLSSPVKAQSLTNFVDLNQSSQFFENGREQFEREINNFPQAFELPNISLPKDYNKLDKIEGKLIKNENSKIQPFSSLAVDNYYIYSVVKL